MKKKILSVFVAVIMLASVVCMIIPASAEEGTANDGWTYMNFNSFNEFNGSSPVTKGNSKFTISENGREATLTGGVSNYGLYDTSSDNTLQKGNAYIISVDVKYSQSVFSSGTTIDNTNRSGGTALVYGLTKTSDTVTPWSSNATKFVAMLQRHQTGTGGQSMFRIFGSGVTDQAEADFVINDETKSRANELKSKANEWINITVYINERGQMTSFLDGRAIGKLSNQISEWNGGNLGIVTHSVKSGDPVSFKDLKYKDVTNPDAGNENSIAAAYWNDVDMAALADQTGNNSSSVWSYDEQSGILTATNTSSNSNDIRMSDISLDANKAYTIEVKGRMAESYTSEGAKSRGFGIIFNSTTQSIGTTWISDSDRYCAMVDRGASGTNQASIFGGAHMGSYAIRTKGHQLTADELAATTPFLLRITIDEFGTVNVYFNGQEAGTHNAMGVGGYIGLIAYSAKTQVDFTDFRYTEGIVDESKLDYTGTSVRIDDKSGIRVKSAISDRLLAKTVETDGYKVIEYGTLVAKAESVAVADMVIDTVGVAKAVAFDADTDTFFEKKDGFTYYTIVLHNIKNTEQEYAFRAYYTVEYEDGTTETFYQTYKGADKLQKSLKGVAEQIINDPLATNDELTYANKVLGK